MIFLNYHDALDQICDAGLLPKTAKNGRGGAMRGDLYIDSIKPVRCQVEEGGRELRGWYWLSTFEAHGQAYISGSFGQWNGAAKEKHDIKIRLDGKAIEQSAEERAAIRKRNAAPAPSLFYGQPRGLKWPPGIYRRVPGRPGKLIPIIVFPQRQAKYRQRFDFYRLADQTVQAEWPRKIEAALQYALATAR